MLQFHFLIWLPFFRYQNPEMEKLLDKDHVEKVEIFLKETVGVDGMFQIYYKIVN